MDIRSFIAGVLVGIFIMMVINLLFYLKVTYKPRRDR